TRAGRASRSSASGARAAAVSFVASACPGYPLCPAAAKSPCALPRSRPLQSLDELAEPLPALLVVAKLVEARARGREEHGVGGLRRVTCFDNRPVQGAGLVQWDAGAAKGGRDLGRCRPDQIDGGAVLRHERRERREVLVLP